MQLLNQFQVLDLEILDPTDHFRFNLSLRIQIVVEPLQFLDSREGRLTRGVVPESGDLTFFDVVDYLIDVDLQHFAHDVSYAIILDTDYLKQ